MFRNIAIPGVAVSMACAGLAQGDVREPVTIVATGVGESAVVAATVPAAERRPILAKAWQCMGRMVQRRPNGSAKSLHRRGNAETWVEWQNLRIDTVRDAGVGESDLKNGVTRRYYCTVKSDAYRLWDPSRVSWSGWHTGSYRSFPWRIEVSWRRGEWIARVDHDGQFIAPGGGRNSGGQGIFRVSASGSEIRVAMR